MGHVTIIQSGDIVELYQYEKEVQPKRISRRTKRRPKETDKRTVTYRRDDNAKRLKKSFIRLVRSNLSTDRKPALFTLTMLEIVSLPESYNALTLFISRLRKTFGRGFSYIAVPEFQKRGAVHFHVLIWGIPEELICTGYFKKNGKYTKFIHTCDPTKPCERHSRYFQNLWQEGFVDCLITDGSPALAHYVGKYMSKTMQDDRLSRAKAYCCSRNIMRPMRTTLKTAFLFSEQAFGIDLSKSEPEREYEFNTKWLGKATYKLFKLS